MECYWHFFITLIFKASIFEMPGTSLIQFEKIHWFNWQRFSCLIDEGIAKFSMKLNLIDYIWSTYLQGWRNRGGGGRGGGVCFPPSPDFDRSVNPLSTRGGRLCPPNYYSPLQIFKPSAISGPERWHIQSGRPIRPHIFVLAWSAIMSWELNFLNIIKYIKSLKDFLWYPSTL